MSDVEKIISLLREHDVWCADASALDALVARYGYRHVMAYGDYLIQSNVPPKERNTSSLPLLIRLDELVGAALLPAFGTLGQLLSSYFARELMAKYGELALYEEKLFPNERLHASILYGLEGFAFSKQNRPIVPEGKRIAGVVPTDALLAGASFATAAKLLDTISDEEVIERVGKYFACGSRQVSSWFNSLVFVRNCCAHRNPLIIRKGIAPLPRRIRHSTGDHEKCSYALEVVGRLLWGAYSGGTPTVLSDLLCYEIAAGHACRTFAKARPHLAQELALSLRYSHSLPAHTRKVSYFYAHRRAITADNT